MRLGAGALDARSHGILVVLDDVHYRQLPKFGHVEGLINLALVGRAVTEIGNADAVIAAILIGKSNSGSERNLCADNAVTTKEILLGAEHVHRAAFALGVS